MVVRHYSQRLAPTEACEGENTRADERKAVDIFTRLRAATNPRASLDDSPSANVVELFLDHLEAQGKARSNLETYQNYAKHLNYFTACAGAVLTRDLTLQHAERFLVKQATKKHRKVERNIVVNGKERRQVNTVGPWGPNMQATFSKILKSCFNWAVETDLISRNPFSKLKRSFTDGTRDIVDDETWQKILEDVTDPAFKDFLTAIRETGCRPSEIRNVTAANVKGVTWNLIKHKTDGSNKIRTVYLNTVMQALTARLVEQTPKGPLFLNSRDTLPET